MKYFKTYNTFITESKLSSMIKDDKGNLYPGAEKLATYVTDQLFMRNEDFFTGKDEVIVRTKYFNIDITFEYAGAIRIKDNEKDIMLKDLTPKNIKNKLTNLIKDKFEGLIINKKIKEIVASYDTYHRAYTTDINDPYFNKDFTTSVLIHDIGYSTSISIDKLISTTRTLYKEINKVSPLHNLESKYKLRDAKKQIAELEKTLLKDKNIAKLVKRLSKIDNHFNIQSKVVIDNKVTIRYEVSRVDDLGENTSGDIGVIGASTASNKYFIIRVLKDKNYADTKEILIHEFSHLFQYLNNSLYYTEKQTEIIKKKYNQAKDKTYMALHKYYTIEKEANIDILFYQIKQNLFNANSLANKDKYHTLSNKNFDKLRVSYGITNKELNLFKETILRNRHLKKLIPNLFRLLRLDYIQNNIKGVEQITNLDTLIGKEILKKDDLIIFQDFDMDEISEKIYIIQFEINQQINQIIYTLNWNNSIEVTLSINDINDIQKYFLSRYSVNLNKLMKQHHFADTDRIKIFRDTLPNSIDDINHLMTMIITYRMMNPEYIKSIIRYLKNKNVIAEEKGYDIRVIIDHIANTQKVDLRDFEKRISNFVWNLIQMFKLYLENNTKTKLKKLFNNEDYPLEDKSAILKVNKRNLDIDEERWLTEYAHAIVMNDTKIDYVNFDIDLQKRLMNMDDLDISIDKFEPSALASNYYIGNYLEGQSKKDIQNYLLNKNLVDYSELTNTLRKYLKLFPNVYVTESTIYSEHLQKLLLLQKHFKYSNDIQGYVTEEKDVDEVLLHEPEKEIRIEGKWSNATKTFPLMIKVIDKQYEINWDPYDSIGDWDREKFEEDLKKIKSF